LKRCNVSTTLCRCFLSVMKISYNCFYAHPVNSMGSHNYTTHRLYLHRQLWSTRIRSQLCIRNRFHQNGCIWSPRPCLHASWYGLLGCDAIGLVNVQVGFGQSPPKVSDSAAISAKFGMHACNMQINIYNVQILA
jgi:hypothetical protein